MEDDYRPVIAPAPQPTWRAADLNLVHSSGLYLGGADGRKHVFALGIKHVFCILTPREMGSTLSGAPFVWFDGTPEITEHVYHVDDDDLEDIVGRVVNDALPRIEAALAAGEPVLVHCMAGVSRSASLVLAYLMKHHQWPFQRALDHLVKIRFIVNPNPGFCRQLQALDTAKEVKEKEKEEEEEDQEEQDCLL